MSMSDSSLFESIVAEAEEGVIVLDKDRRVRYANPAAERLLGYPRNEIVGEMFGWPLVAKEKATRINALAPEGRLRTLELLVEPFPLQQSELILRLKDISSFQEDLSEATEQVRRRDEFLAMLSHEIRNPLSAIQTASAILSRADVSPAVRAEASAIAERQFHHLNRIIDDLLDVSRLSQNKLRIQRQEVELRAVVRDAVAAAAELNGRAHQLVLDLPRENVLVSGDPTRLEQAFVNLINNAAKFTPNGGRIDIGMQLCGEEVVLAIKDNGPGIPEELLPTIFEPFTQGKQSLDRSNGGLGIGLTLTDHIVRRHEGAIQINSSRDGTAISVTLPRCHPAKPAERSETHETAGPLRILLIEDSIDARTMLAEILRMDGHVVLESSDGIEGLQILLAERPNVALVDIGLPGIDGYEVARRARRELNGSTLRMVAVTGYGMPQDITQATEAGFDAHVIKPVRYPDLCSVLFAGERESK